MKKFLIIAVIAIIAAVTGYFIWQNNSKDTTITLYGNVDIRTVNSNFRVAGRLTELSKEEGDYVKVGDLLATIDDEPYQIGLQQAQAQVLQAQATYDYAERNFQRQSELMKTNAVSKDQLDNSKTARDQAQANLALALANVEQAKLNITDSQLYSPTEGTILTRAIEVGTMLNSATTVYAISIAKPIWIKAYIDEINLAQAIPGRKVYIYTDARPNEPYIGQIGFVSSTAEFTPKTVQTEVLRTDLVYRLRIQVNQNGEGKADELLRQGMPVTIKFQ
ncbi:secretion protein HlyD [Orbus sasakiae]|uniref:Secretion protein HlyD n=1 Tax=Orbus sasakiae TaxID=1078475 RepID=A0ABP9N5R6_9GAMM